MKKAVKIISIILSITLFFGMIPGNVYAEFSEDIRYEGDLSSDIIPLDDELENEELPENEPEPAGDVPTDEQNTAAQPEDGAFLPAEMSEEDMKIVSECEEKRNVSEKHFRLACGAYEAVQYNNAVHYKRSGEENWTEIDNTLVEKTDASGNKCLSPSDSPVGVFFAADVENEHLVQYTVGEYKVSWDLHAEKSPTRSPEVQEIEFDENLKNKRITDCLVKNTSKLRYGNIIENVDLEYTVAGDTLEESYILNAKEAPNVFTFDYNVGDLRPEQKDPQTVVLLDDKDEEILTLAAPYMYDSAGMYSNAVELHIDGFTDGILTLSVIAERDWLDADDRAYPVTIDPYIFEKVSNTFISGSALYNNPGLNSYPDGSLLVGASRSYVKMRSYIQFSLPQLSAGDIVVGGSLNLYQRPGGLGFSSDTSTTQMYIYASQVTDAWTYGNESSYNNIKLSSGFNGLPTHADYYLDYILTSWQSSYTLRWFDISKALKAWIDDPSKNHGIVLTYKDDAAQNPERIYTWFASTNYPSYSVKPFITVVYLNNRGLEDRWTYHTVSLGDSGSAHVCDCTGNLVYVAPITHTNGLKAPLNVSLVYNGYLSDAAGLGGKGWNFDFEQKVTAISSNDELYSNGYRYIYTDSDGTMHYFKTDNGNIVDEEGLNLKITENANSTDARYTISSDSGDKLEFNSSGKLRKAIDAESRTVEYVYTSGKVTSIKDGNNAVTTVAYSGNFVSSITDPYSRTVSFTYNSSNQLTQITYPDAGNTSFTYIGGKLQKVVGVDGTGVEFAYDTTANADASIKNRVVRIAELSTSGTEGNYIALSYSYIGYTKFEDRRNRTDTYLFDNYGRTVCIKDALGGAEKYTYHKYDSARPTDKRNNALTSAAVKAIYVSNFAVNHSFENDLSGWTTSVGEASSAQAYIGNKSLKIANTSPSGGTAYQRIYIGSRRLIAGNTYTYSAYVKTTEVNANAYLYVTCWDTATGTPEIIKTYGSRHVNEKTDFTRISVKFEVPTETDFINIGIKMKGTSGSSYFDCVQIESGSAANDYNILENSDFEDQTSSVWIGQNLSGNDGYYNSNVNGSYRIIGSETVDKRVYQRVKINKPATCAFSVSGIVNARSVPKKDEEGREISLKIKFNFTDGTNEKQTVEFNTDIAKIYQYTAGIVKPKTENSEKTIASIDFFFCYYKNKNSAFFDRASLTVDETGTSYVYDGNGNLVSSVDNAGRTQTFNYNSANDLTGESFEDNTAYTYTYATTGNTHRIISAESERSHIKFEFAYGNTGNVTSVTARVAGMTKYILNEKTYTDDDNFLSTETDTLGNTTTYSYNDKGLLSAVKDARNHVVHYMYDSNNDYIKQAFMSLLGKVSYSYDTKRKLTSVTSSPETDPVVYNFTYNAFNNLLTAKVGTQLLSKNNYAPNNGNLTSTQYGNLDAVNYTYDSVDRMTKKVYNGAEYSWVYDARGNVAKFSDEVEDKTYTYTYDLSNRLIQSYRSDNAYLRQSFNAENLTSSVSFGFGGTTGSAVYTYNNTKDNAPAQVKFADNTRENLTYDALGRTESTGVYNSSGHGVFLSSYTYKDKNTAQTSGVVSRMKNAHGSTVFSDYSYTYDANGNITLITTGDNYCIQYTYDSLNRLTRCDDEIAEKTWTFTYDKKGNITCKKIYPCYLIGQTLGTPDTTANYTYGNSNWADLLTAYKDYAITYDAIGNMTSYNGRTLTWSGRRLASFNYNNKTTTYTYNAEGIRTSKTVDGVTTEYFLNGTQILAQKTGDNSLKVFYYDQNGKRVAFRNTDGAVYFYVYNLQGDVVQLLDSSHNVVGEYIYGPYGYLENSSSLTTVARANPFRYRGYYYDSENGYYYLNARYYYPVFGRFISADDPTYIGARRELTSYNLFSYCCNNPIALSDPNGTIAITTIILVGASVIGAGVALYTGYKMRKAGADWYDTIFYSVGNGLCAACTVGTLGLCAYDFYYDLSWYTGHVPVTEIHGNVEPGLQRCADAANDAVEGYGSVSGTKKHTVFKDEVGKINNSYLQTEVSYLDGKIVPYGTKNSIRFDVMLYNRYGDPIHAWDFKTGNAYLSASRIAIMQERSGLTIPISMIK